MATESTRSDSRRDGRGLERLENAIVRVTTWVALVFFVFLIAAGLLSGESDFFWEALNPAVPGIAGAVMIARATPRALVQLAASGVMIAITVGVLGIGSQWGALLGLVSMGIVGALLVRERSVLYLASAAVGLYAVAYWWNVGEWSNRERLTESLVPALAFLFAAGLVIWLKRELLAEGRRKTEALEALTASEQQFRMAFESSAAIQALLSLEDGRFIEMNRAGCELLGFTEEELLAMTTTDIVHPDDRASSRYRFAAIANGEVDQAQAVMRLVKKGGSEMVGLVSSALVADGQGKPLHLVSQVVDLTDQHAAEERLIELLASRDELIAAVSHELRTPLTAVMGYASLLMESIPGPPPEGYEVMVQEIADQGADLVAIIEDLLVFAQSDSNNLKVLSEAIDLRDQVTLVLESLKSEMAVEHVRVAGDRLAGIGDPVRVRQILRNLFTNAGRYGGDTVDVGFRQLGDRVCVTVADDGDGIPEQDRVRVFEPYQRSQPKEGLTASIGIGLTVARRLAHLMDGDLTYEYRDGMSRFCLSLPMLEDVSAAATR